MEIRRAGLGRYEIGESDALDGIRQSHAAAYPLLDVREHAAAAAGIGVAAGFVAGKSDVDAGFSGPGRIEKDRVVVVAAGAARDGVVALAGGNVDDVGLGAGVDKVVAGARLDGVAPEATLDRVISRPAVERIVAIAAIERIVAIAAEERVVARLAVDRVVATTAVDPVVAPASLDRVLGGSACVSCGPAFA